MLHDRTLLKHGSRLHLQDTALFNQAVPYVLGKVGKPGMVLKDDQLTAIQHVHNGKNVFVWLHTYDQVDSCMRSYYLYHALRPLLKGRSGVSPSTDFETMASHDAGVKYLSVLFQLISR